MTRDELLAGMAILEAATDKAFTDAQVTVWFDLLGDLNGQHFLAAVKRALLESEFPGLPPIGRIRRYATEAAVGVPESPEAMFERVRAAISQHGYCDPVGASKLLGPTLWSVIQGIGGWERICDSPIDQRATLFAQFRDAWNRAAERAATNARLPEDSRPKLMDLGPVNASLKRLAESLGVPHAV